MDEPKILKPTAEELKTILEEHRKWRASDGASGARANLADAYLAGANLADAYLADAYLTDAYLADAYLARANLAGAYLTGANLTGANLTGAYLTGANLTGAYLADAYLADANLTGAYLADANLTGANLTGAYLTGANLTGAYLADANLAGANLADANLAGVRDDFYKVLNAAPAEVLGLLDALRAGKVDGSSYEGPCACLVGTIANVRGVQWNHVPGLQPDASRPAEKWFMHINKGDTPQNNQVAAIVEKWILDWKPPVVEAAPVAAPAVAE